MNKEIKWLIVIVGVLIASALIIGGLTLFLSPAAPDENDQAAGETDGSSIAFASDLEGTTDVYVMSPSGSNRKKVSNPDLGVCLYPTWSPDGQQVAYWGAEGDSFWDRDALPGVWVSAADGSAHAHVSPDVTVVSSLLPPAWSPDGTKLAYAAVSDPGGDPTHAIYIAWADGSGTEQTIPLPWEAQHLAWSLSGDDLLLVGRTTDGGSAYLWSGEEEALVEISANVEAADWSPDGKEIVIGDTAGKVVMAIGRDGERRPIAEFGGARPLAVAWSPDGTRIAVGTSHSTVWGLWSKSFGLPFSTSLHVVTIESGETVTVINESDRVQSLAWSLDGSRLLFTRVNPRRRVQAVMPHANLWSYDVASGELKQVTDEIGYAGAGVWSP